MPSNDYIQQQQQHVTVSIEIRDCNKMKTLRCVIHVALQKFNILATFCTPNVHQVANFFHSKLSPAAGCYGKAVHKCHMENFEACGEPLEEFRKEMGQRFPTTEEHVNQLCKDLDETEKCFTQFKTQCMTPMQTELVDLMSEGMYEVFNSFCTAGSKMRTDYLEHAQCMNDAYDSEEYKSLSSYVEAALEEMLEKPDSERLVTACCGYQWMDNKSKQLGTEKCGADAVEAFNEVINTAVSTLPDMMCQGFDPESQLCTKALPAPGATPKGTIRDTPLGQKLAALYLSK